MYPNHKRPYHKSQCTPVFKKRCFQCTEYNTALYKTSYWGQKQNQCKRIMPKFGIIAMKLIPDEQPWQTLNNNKKNDCQITFCLSDGLHMYMYRVWNVYS